MAIVLSMIIFLLLFSSSKSMKTTCEISSVETGKDANLTIYFEDNLRNAASMDFIVLHVRDGSTESQMLSCRFTNGAAECDKTDCCTWEKQVTDVFHVYIHNVSQELEGKFWGVVLPAEGAHHTYCNFSLKVPTCSLDSINATNIDKTCNNQPVPIGKTCKVICEDGYNFQDTQTSVTYTCVGSNKWSPELPDRFCEYHSERTETNKGLIALIVIIPVIIAILFLIWFIIKKMREAEKDTTDTTGGVLPLLDDERIDETNNHGQMVDNNWLECVKKWYPHFDSQTYFLPALLLIQVPYCMEKIAGEQELVPQIKKVALESQSDVPDNRALQQVLNGIRTLARNDGLEEAMFVVSQLQFDNYLGEPTFATAAELLPRPSTLPEDLRQQHYDKGDFDVLIIHKKHGLFTLEISSVGDFTQDKATVEMEDVDLINNVNQIIKQLNKNEIVLKHLTSDLQPNITKCLAIPNITSSQLQRTINRNPSFQQVLCKCLGVESAAGAMKLCLLSDQLSDNQTPSDENYISPQTLGQWWRNVCNTPGAQPVKAPLLYEQLLPRFCGPATTVEVHRVTAPRLNIRTLWEAVYKTGERVARLVLFPQQVDILTQSPSRAFLSGPPGTGKTILLILQGLTWLQRGYDVHVVSTWDESRAATFLIEHQLQETTETPTARSRVHQHQFDLKNGNVETAVRRLISKRKDLAFCVIADTVVRYGKRFRTFCDQLNDKMPGVYIWGASMFHKDRPSLLEEFKLTRPLRSPPAVVSEVMKAEEIRNELVNVYDICDDSVPTDSPPLERISHHANQSGHTCTMPHNCEECGRQVALILGKLNVGETGDSNASLPLKYCDVLVLCCDYPTDDSVDSNGQVLQTASGLVKGLRYSHVPVRVVEKNNENAIRDTAIHVSDFVTVANLNDVLGLERKLVIVENGTDTLSERLYAMSRCMSQLVVIDYLVLKKCSRLI